MAYVPILYPSVFYNVDGHAITVASPADGAALPASYVMQPVLLIPTSAGMQDHVRRKLSVVKFNPSTTFAVIIKET